MTVRVIFSLIAGWPSGIVPRPALHGSGLDEMVCLVLPMVLLGVVFLFVMRVRPPEDNQEEPGSAVEADMPKPLGHGDERRSAPPAKDGEVADPPA